MTAEALCHPSTLLLDVGGLGTRSRTPHSAPCEQQRLGCHCWCRQSRSDSRVNRAQWEKPFCLVCLNSPSHAAACSSVMGNPLHTAQNRHTFDFCTEKERTCAHMATDCAHLHGLREQTHKTLTHTHTHNLEAPVVQTGTGSSTRVKISHSFSCHYTRRDCIMRFVHFNQRA